MARKKQEAFAPLENEQYYKDTAWLALPLLCMPCYLYGWRPLLLCLVAILIAKLCDRTVAFLRGRPRNRNDRSSESFAIVLTLLLPASVSWYVLVVAVIACVLIGKEAFGGYGSYPFHPAAVGYVVAAISWPAQLFLYPQPHTTVPFMMSAEVPLVHGMSNVLKNGGLPIVPVFDLSLGDYAGPIGATAVLVLVACALFLWVRRDIHITVCLSFLLVCAAVAFLFPRQLDLVGPILETVPQRLTVVKFELLSGVMIYGAVMLICEPYTCPKHWVSRILYGALLGAFTMAFRYLGVYETGVCFALLWVGTIGGWLERVIHQIFGKFRVARVQKKGGTV